VQRKMAAEAAAGTGDQKVLVAEIVLHRWLKRPQRPPICTLYPTKVYSALPMRPIHHVLLLLLPCVALAQEQVPTELFGVPLGGTYQLKEDGSHTLPVAKVTGLIRNEAISLTWSIRKRATST
jgi:hypothetical protein